MDPVLTGSLCFLVLAIVMYVKFIREHPMNEDEDLHHHHAKKARKSSPIEPDSVPFLHPASPTSALQKTPLSPRQGHHGLAVLQKAAQYKNLQSSYYQQKQPMRRRAHSAATNNGAHGQSAAPVVTPPPPDAEMGLPLGGAAPRSSHRIDFGNMEFDQDSGGFHRSPRHLGDSMLPIAYEHHEDAAAATGFGEDLESRLPAGETTVTDSYRLDDIEKGGPSAPAAAEPVEAKPAVDRPFVREPVPQPAQMQLEVARKARIPLFLHSPMYVKTSAAPIDDLPVPDRANEGGVGAMRTPRMKDKLPAPCHKNNSLHIDYSELQVGEMIGQGAFGTVHRAMWRGTTVAVKVLVCQYLTADILEEFETEVQIMSILRHPNICLLMGACLEPPTRCLVIEYLPRGSLWNVLRQDFALDYDKQMTFSRDTALGMNYLHSFQPPILHRDLKSPNLLVDTSYAIKISDFGLARVRAHFQTMTGNCGTTQWMAPEVLAAEKYTEKADVFSYGVVCWEIITRACPYDGLSQIQAALGVLNNSLRPTIPPDCPPLFKKLMTLCWVSSPEKRPTFEQILEILHSNDQGLLEEVG
ncbi:hypothetical protein Poli38472_006037 [Pythium oligandrum]|uniref:non-specific serine/threonine protein kinase n=1 Tax=Pythium oligandrum TaxID=41045 RepID=A0A8K1CSS5_PYTOL|nr:hypothetical protein Poli38472_006037 [Pythium oligandrum]|eukprot:TMW68569.1 hypothetical protein Poli38472_006037 [Pythium oligandrum]